MHHLNSKTKKNQLHNSTSNLSTHSINQNKHNFQNSIIQTTLKKTKGKEKGTTNQQHNKFSSQPQQKPIIPHKNPNFNKPHSTKLPSRPSRCTSQPPAPCSAYPSSISQHRNSPIRYPSQARTDRCHALSEDPSPVRRSPPTDPWIQRLSFNDDDCRVVVLSHYRKREGQRKQATRGRRSSV